MISKGKLAQYNRIQDETLRKKKIEEAEKRDADREQTKKRPVISAPVEETPAPVEETPAPEGA